MGAEAAKIEAIAYIMKLFLYNYLLMELFDP